MVAAFRMHSCSLECKVKLSPTCQVQSFLAAGKISVHLLELRCFLLTSLANFSMGVFDESRYVRNSPKRLFE